MRGRKQRRQEIHTLTVAFCSSSLLFKHNTRWSCETRQQQDDDEEEEGEEEEDTLAPRTPQKEREEEER